MALEFSEIFYGDMPSTEPTLIDRLFLSSSMVARQLTTLHTAGLEGYDPGAIFPVSLSPLEAN